LRRVGGGGVEAGGWGWVGWGFEKPLRYVYYIQQLKRGG